MPFDVSPEPGLHGHAPDAATLQTIPRAAERTLDAATANAVVGPVQNREGRTVIPLANVSAGYGFGLGTGHGAGADGEGGGGGGGGGARVRPVAVLEITDAGVRVHQVVDSTRITLASLALAAWSVYWIMRTIRAFRRR